jgi:hypothetical protein
MVLSWKFQTTGSAIRNEDPAPDDDTVAAEAK